MKKPKIKLNPNGKVKHQFLSLQSKRFIIGYLYLFHPMKKHCPSRSSLWGIYDKTEDGIIYLESSTLDLHHFSIWHRLPDGYRYTRRATRRELRDYMYNLGHSDSRMQQLNANKQMPKIRLQSLFICPRVRYSFPRDMHNTTEGGLIAPSMFDI